MSEEAMRVLCAAYTAKTITVYQAYAPRIADAAVRAGTFVPPFSRNRMTWIKSSFGWMMHRSGWAAKPGQERILAIEITRVGFEWALAHSCLVGLSGEAMHRYCDEWISSITDITATVRRAGQLVRVGRIADAARQLPAEQTYPLGPALTRRIGAEPGHPPPVAASGAQ